MTGCDFLGILCTVYRHATFPDSKKELLQDTVINHEFLCNPGEMMTIVDHGLHGFGGF